MCADNEGESQLRNLTSLNLSPSPPPPLSAPAPSPQRYAPSLRLLFVHSAFSQAKPGARTQDVGGFDAYRASAATVNRAGFARC